MSLLCSDLGKERMTDDVCDQACINHTTARQKARTEQIEEQPHEVNTRMSCQQVL